MGNQEPAPWPGLFTLVGNVSRRHYLIVGVSLMTLKFSVEAALGYVLTGALPSPLVYVAPSFRLRNTLLGNYDGFAGILALSLWSLPFAWVGVTMSVRRARDAGLPSWLGLGFFVPVLNYLFMAILAATPTRAPTAQVDSSTRTHDPGRVGAALQGVFAGGLVGLILAGVLASLYGKYGASVFLGTPFLIGTCGGFFYCRALPRALGETMLVGVVSQVAGAMLLLLFAAEGVICLTMALPLALPAGALGAAVGRSLAGVEPDAVVRSLSVPLLVLPLMTAAEAERPSLRQVETRVVVDAPPERVWDIVVAFPEIPQNIERSWLFDTGVASPLRARIEGHGVGAVRHCEFTTGAFVEPVTVWNPPHHLAFDVTSQPEPMTELSFWRHVHAPHLVNGTLRSERGEFRLNRLPGGKTELVGRTWYRVSMEPEQYWAVWVDVIVHEVHLRVLRHIARVAASPERPQVNAPKS